MLYRLTPPNIAYSFLDTISYHFSDKLPLSQNTVCLDHDYDLLKPQLISTWMPNSVGALPGKRAIFTESQVWNYIYIYMELYI